MSNTNTSNKKRSQWVEVWRRLKRNKMAVLGLIILIILVLLAVFADVIANYDNVVIKQNLAHRLQGPSAAHWLGTDEFGRDIFARLVHGTRVSLQVGIVAVGISIVIGGILGAVAGYYGGKLDNVLMRFAEIVYSLPFTPMIIAVASTMLWVPQSQKMYTVSLLIGLLSWPGLARLVRGQILTLREQEFMQACEALGISDFSKIFKHLLPNVISLVIVNATLQMASAILTEAGLSFLGMGVTAPTPSWGNLMNLARDSYVFQNYPWEWMPAGLMCLLTVISINLIGEGLRDAFDPKELQ